MSDEKGKRSTAGHDSGRSPREGTRPTIRPASCRHEQETAGGIGRGPRMSRGEIQLAPENSRKFEMKNTTPTLSESSLMPAIRGRRGLCPRCPSLSWRGRGRGQSCCRLFSLISVSGSAVEALGQREKSCPAAFFYLPNCNIPERLLSFVWGKLWAVDNNGNRTCIRL